MSKKWTNWLLGTCLTVFGLLGTEAICLAYTANQVSFEFRPNGSYRVNLYYTIPAMKEFREASVDFSNRKKAEKFYFDVVKGADFYVDAKGDVEFKNDQLSPHPW